MNTIELAVYNLVKRNPRLKMGVRNAYQRICDVVPVKRAESAYEIIAREGFYFGFHDKTPWSADETKLLANRVLVPLRMPQPDDELEVGFVQGSEYREFVPVGRTRAWNWQQGCMLQWLGTSGKLIFNDFDGERHIARVFGEDGCEQETVPFPVAAVSSDGALGLSYSFERCRVYSPGYGYSNGADPEENRECPAGHGIRLLNLNTGDHKQLFSIGDVATVQPDSSMADAFHYLTHCQFSPTGRSFVFFHRWIKDFNHLRTRMLSFNLETKKLFIFPTDGMVSHVAWQDDEHVLAYARLEGAGDHYVLFENKTGCYELVGENLFNSDGHPSFSPDKRWVVTDTYPDRFRVMYLAIYDTQTKCRYNVAKLRSPRSFASPRLETNWHCDLHPRWNRAGTAVCFDSAHSGKRSLCTIHFGNRMPDKLQEIN